MLYLDFAKNREDFILEEEETLPLFCKKILYLFRKLTGRVIEYDIAGKNVVLISKLNQKTFKKLDKIFKTDVTKNVCVCDLLKENEEFVDFLEARNLNIMNGKWLFGYLVSDISEFICHKLDVTPEAQEISVAVNEPNALVFETIKKLSDKVKNINIITNKIRKFEKLEKDVYEKNGLLLNVTNNFKKAGLKSRIIFNFDFDEKSFNKIIFLPDATIVNLQKYIAVKQSNFHGRMVDFYSVNLPRKYQKIYSRLRNFNSSILYESFIYKKTCAQNIWNEIQNDKVEIIILESQNKVVNF